jgi:hypothetical protein
LIDYIDIMVVKYSHTRKQKLANKLEKIEDKVDLKAIKKIIYKHNPDLEVAKKSKHLVMYFHNLTDKTYTELDNYIQKKLLKKCAEKIQSINDIETTLSNESETLNSILSVSDNETIKYKYSNREKNLMRRKKYESTINEMNGTHQITVDFENYNMTEDSTSSSKSNDVVKNIFLKKT